MGISIAADYVFVVQKNTHLRIQMRQFFTRGMDFGRIMQSDIDIALELSDNRLWKCLNYRTPKKVFGSKPMRCA
jgi:IS30 family transposase